MDILSDSINDFLSDNNRCTFFVQCSQSEYDSLLERYDDLKRFKLSDYCSSDDVFPDMDRFCRDISESDIDSIVLGLSEYCVLVEDSDIFYRIKDLHVSSHVIVLSRFSSPLIGSMSIDDAKFSELRVLHLGCQHLDNIFRVNIDFPLDPKIHGFKSLLERIEIGYGCSLRYYIVTSLHLANVKSVSIYDLLDCRSVPENALKPEHWMDYYRDRNFNGYPFVHWRTFLDAKLNGSANPYLDSVASHSESYEDYKALILLHILDADFMSSDFWHLYAKRKEILSNSTIDVNDMIGYINRTSAKGRDRIYYLTDSTDVEKYEVIKWIVEEQTIPEHLDMIYPDLFAYISNYIFKNEFGDVLSDYFHEYRFSKLFNKISPSLSVQVQQQSVADNHLFYSLKPRDRIVNRIDHDNTYLVWIDALGIEYLPFIQKMIDEYRLDSSVTICSSHLPTITEKNSDFFFAWPESSRCKESEFDNLLHEGINGFNSAESLNYPFHLVRQLQIIKEWMAKVSNILNMGSYRCVILVSDHGASRFPIFNFGETIEMTNPGEKSGRICKFSDKDKKIESAILDDGYWSLSTYDRFKGGNRQGVEVHGGATLEEVLVPVIVLSLGDESLTFDLATPSLEFSNDQGFTLIIVCNTVVEDITVSISEKPYKYTRQGKKILVEVNDIKRSGTYVLKVFKGDSLKATFDFKVSGKLAKMNMNDDWFT